MDRRQLSPSIVAAFISEISHQLTPSTIATYMAKLITYFALKCYQSAVFDTRLVRNCVKALPRRFWKMPAELPFFT